MRSEKKTERKIQRVFSGERSHTQACGDKAKEANNHNNNSNSEKRGTEQKLRNTFSMGKDTKSTQSDLSACTLHSCNEHTQKTQQKSTGNEDEPANNI